MKQVVTTFLLLVICSTMSMAQVPAITSFSPSSGGVPTRVTIYGSNFSATPANNVVRFGTAQATPSVAFADSLYVTAPGNATYGPVTVTVGGKTASSSRVYFTTFGGGGFNASSFQIPASTSVSSNSQTLVYADLDGDGKLDIILPQNSGSNVRVARNTTSTAGSFTFATSVDVATSWIGPRGVAASDIDGDGKLDVVVACQGAASPGRLSVLRNTSTSGTISFAAGVNFRDTTDFLYIPYDVAVADFDKDGRPDVVTAGQLSSGFWLHVFRNVSSAGSITTSSFEQPTKVSAGGNARRIKAADFDGDGKVDVAVLTANGPTNVVNVYRNSTVGSAISFASPITLTLPSAEIIVGDLNADGKPEIIGSSAPTIDGLVSIFQNVSVVGDITFNPAITLNLPAYGIQVDVADVDGDAKPDITVMGNNQVHIFRNLISSGTITAQSFASRVDLTGFSAPTSASFGLADIDGDAKPEITIAGYGSQVTPIVVMKNRISSGFTPAPINTGTTADLQGVSFISRNNGCIAGRGGVVRVTTNGGSTWTASNTGTSADLSGIRLIGARAFITGSGGLISVSTNNGASWVPSSMGTSETFNGSSFTSETAGWAVGTSGVIYIYNGSSWVAQTSGTTSEFKSVYAIGSTGYAVGASGTIRKYSGSSWVSQTSGTSVTLNDAAFADVNTGFAVGLSSTICKTTNGGTTWTQLSTGYTGLNIRSIKLANANVAWATADGGVVLQSSDGGTTWTSTALGSSNLKAIDFVQGQGIIVGDGGTGYSFQTNLVSVRENPISSGLPVSFTLEQNYPNPFNPSTKIEFRVSSFEFVSLKVFDILGREVATLVSETLRPGSYEQTFEGGTLASGVYLYTLHSGGFSQTKRMILMK